MKIYSFAKKLPYFFCCSSTSRKASSRWCESYVGYGTSRFVVHVGFSAATAVGTEWRPVSLHWRSASRTGWTRKQLRTRPTHQESQILPQVSLEAAKLTIKDVSNVDVKSWSRMLNSKIELGFSKFFIHLLLYLTYN